MRMLTGEETGKRLDNIVHLDTQAAAFGLDLTAASVYRITGSGQLDFGGSEYEEAPHERLAPERAKPDDDYGWWELKAGTYLLRYNEHVKPGSEGLALIQPHERLLKAGAHHPTLQIQEAREQVETLLSVAERGVRIKENARVSKLLILESSRE